MNDSIDLLKKIYKPYRYTFKKNVTFLYTMSGDYVVKNKENNISDIYDYLKSRNFDYFPKLIDSSRSDVNVFEFIKDTKMPKEQKGLDMINLVSLLHNKTTYYKVVGEDNYKYIYDTIKSNIDYINKYYRSLIVKIKKHEYMSPSEYLIIRNSSTIFSCINFCYQELDNWFEGVKNEKKQRVCLIHNNLSLDHFIKNDKDYLISWDKSRVDSPVLDLIKFYQNNYFDLDFETILTNYEKNYNLNEYEKKLLFIVISLPKKIDVEKEEFDTCINVRKFLDYMFKTDDLIRPYYSIKQEN